MCPDFLIQPFAESLGHRKDSTVADQSYDVSCAVEYRRAMLADLKMCFHPVTQFSRDLSVKIIGDFPPDFNATDLNAPRGIFCIHHDLTFRYCSAFVQEPSNPGAKASLNSNLAR